MKGRKLGVNELVWLEELAPQLLIVQVMESFHHDCSSSTLSCLVMQAMIIILNVQQSTSSALTPSLHQVLNIQAMDHNNYSLHHHLININMLT